MTARFIELHRLDDGRPFWVNPDHIVSVSTLSGQTRLWLAHEGHVLVQEAVADIAARLAGPPPDPGRRR